MLADKGDTAFTALGGEYWGFLGKPGGELLGDDEALLTGELGGVGVLGGEGLCLDFVLGEALGVLGAPDELQCLPRN